MGACLYVLTVIAFAVAGRGEAAKVVARFVPDCVVLFGRLMRDPRVPRRRKLLVVTLLWRCRSTWCPISSRSPASWTTRSWLVETGPGPKSPLNFLLRLVGVSATGSGS